MIECMVKYLSERECCDSFPPQCLCNFLTMCSSLGNRCLSTSVSLPPNHTPALFETPSLQRLLCLKVQCVFHLQWQEKFCNMASQIKLLLEIPERIWSAMEAFQYLQATQLYLLCCHLHNLLRLEAATGGLYSPVLARFPILVRQVATTGHFRYRLLFLVFFCGTILTCLLVWLRMAPFVLSFEFDFSYRIRNSLKGAYTDPKLYDTNTRQLYYLPWWKFVLRYTRNTLIDK